MIIRGHCNGLGRAAVNVPIIAFGTIWSRISGIIGKWTKGPSTPSAKIFQFSLLTDRFLTDRVKYQGSSRASLADKSGKIFCGAT